jgi:hypothetical protein
MCVGLHVKYPLFLSALMKLEFFAPTQTAGEELKIRTVHRAFPGVQRPRCAFDHPAKSSAEVKERIAVSSTPSLRLHGILQDKLYFTVHSGRHVRFSLHSITNKQTNKQTNNTDFACSDIWSLLCVYLFLRCVSQLICTLSEMQHPKFVACLCIHLGFLLLNFHI